MDEAASPAMAVEEVAEKREDTTRAGIPNPSSCSTSSSPSLFPLPSKAAFPIPPAPNLSSADNFWLSNTSFTFDVSSLQVLGAGAHESVPEQPQLSSPESDGKAAAEMTRPPAAYDLLPSSPSGSSPSSSEEDLRSRRKERERRRRRKKRRKERENDQDEVSRKPGVRAWAGSDTKPAGKDYYFDAQGDKDNLVFGSLYRMDVARHKLQHIAEFSELMFKAYRSWKSSASYADIEPDHDALDGKLRVGGRYYSVKYKAIEKNKGFKRVKVDKVATPVFPEEFIPLVDSHPATETCSTKGEFEQSWEDETIRRTKEFNQMTRDRPYDEKVWLAFAEFQDKVASTQSQKAARLQMLEKKISILEKAVELNPDNEELLLCLLKTYQARDSTDFFLKKWETVLIQHSDSYKLWKEFLHVCQGEFSRFKVSEMRKTYANAIQALASACNKQRRQDGESASLHVADSALVQLELDLVDIFISLCRLEWQAGYQELATGLFQAEIEYNLFCPSLLLSSQSKHRLFEHFWSSGAARIGEDGAVGWSSWLEKDELNRQKTTVNDGSSENEEGGWSGWFELSSKRKGTSKESDVSTETTINDGEKSEENVDTEDDLSEDNINTLLKKLGVDINAEPNNEIKDGKTWNRWSEEELSRDLKQWMPVREKPGNEIRPESPHPDHLEKEGHEQLSRIVLFEDISDYMFSLSTKDAQFSLVCQFIEFYGGEIAQWLSSNKSSYIEKIFSLETLPESILEDIKDVYDVVNTTGHSSNLFELDSVFHLTNDLSRKASKMKFIRNAILLIVDALPRNHILEKALLRAEELSIREIRSSTSSVNPSQALAKSLLKKDRQDILLCGVYARSEAAYDNLIMARKIFDMALSSTDGLPAGLRENVPLLYFWYADVELSVSPPSGNSELSRQRAVHILSCLGGNAKYTPFTCQPSAMLILRARQGFKEQLKSLRLSWSRGVVKEHSVALVCSASLFEFLTNSWSAGIQVIEETLPLALPERRAQSLHLELLWNYYLEMLQKHLKELKFSRVWKIIEEGLQMYPYNSKIYKAMLRVGSLYSVPSKVRLLIDECNQRNSSLVMWLFAFAFEYGKGDSQNRIHSLFERALADDKLKKSVLMWRCYLAYEVNVAKNNSAARRIFFRAIHACPWSKRLWLDGFQMLSSILSAKELSDLQEVMADKELNLRTDIYEILLEDDEMLE